MIQTASFYTYPSSGAGRISIARVAPRWYPRGFHVFRDLAPGSWFNSVDYDEYRRLYFEQLARLDPAGVVDALYSLASAPVLLCYEKPPFDTERNFCHRRMVAEWLEGSLGLEVMEWSGLHESNMQRQLEL